MTKQEIGQNGQLGHSMPLAARFKWLLVLHLEQLAVKVTA